MIEIKLILFLIGFSEMISGVLLLFYTLSQPRSERWYYFLLCLLFSGMTILIINYALYGGMSF